jgi:NodT family efflux transporter outer membrane factor (OMF) lipoprotein
MTAVLTLLCSCNLAPHYHRPAEETPVAFKEAGGWMTAEPADAAPRGRWWEAYGDKELNALEEKAGAGNQDLKAALARYEEARAGARAARADYFPNITGTAYDFRERSSPNYSALTNGKPFNDYLAEADISYEIDLWGRVRNEVATAKHLAKASGGDLAAVDLSLRAELASDYFALRADDAEQIVLDETAVDYGKALDLTRDRFKGGVSAEADVDQAETQYQTTRTQASDLRLKRAQLEHAIAVLTGASPSGFTLASMPLDAAQKMPSVNPGIPSKLLERRPDIAAAERRVMAANAQIGVARAAWFPDFTIQGLLGFESASSSNWLTAGSRIWSLGPQAVVPIFDAGRINALSDQARAAYDENAAAYRKTVLTAYREVEDNLAALRRLEQESQSQSAAADAADRSLRQSQDRYTGGIITYLDVVVVQNIALQARLALIDIEARRLTASVQLIKALGGGWDAPPAVPAAAFIGPPAPEAVKPADVKAPATFIGPPASVQKP